VLEVAESAWVPGLMWRRQLDRGDLEAAAAEFFESLWRSLTIGDDLVDSFDGNDGRKAASAELA
jgi:hypothetical protein